MPYLDEAGLAYYDPKIKEWIASQPVKTIPSSLYPWTLTEKAGAVTCWPVGETPLLSTVDFMFTEIGPASGDKGPDNPSIITGVSSITVTRCETVGMDEMQYTFPLGGAFYGGTLYLATGAMTVTWTAVRIGDFQNSLQYNSANNRWEIFVTPKANYSISAICTHSIFKNGSEFTDATDGVFRWAAGNSGQWLWFKSLAATAEAFLAIYENAYVAFALATPYTVQLTPTEILSLAQSDKYTPRLNTVYTDASAVQVGYVKSPIREEFELRQAIVAQGGNV